MRFSRRDNRQTAVLAREASENPLAVERDF